MKIFLSYGHDPNAALVAQVRKDLQCAGHAIWINSEQIRHAARDPDNAEWQRDLFVSAGKLADIHAAMGEAGPAREYAARTLAQAQALVRRYPDFAQHAKDLRTAEDLHRRVCGPKPG